MPGLGGTGKPIKKQESGGRWNQEEGFDAQPDESVDRQPLAQQAIEAEGEGERERDPGPLADDPDESGNAETGQGQGDPLHAPQTLPEEDHAEDDADQWQNE